MHYMQELQDVRALCARGLSPSIRKLLIMYQNRCFKFVHVFYAGGAGCAGTVHTDISPSIRKLLIRYQQRYCKFVYMYFKSVYMYFTQELQDVRSLCDEAGDRPVILFLLTRNHIQFKTPFRAISTVEMCYLSLDIASP
jgi:hypothetical protein